MGVITLLRRFLKQNALTEIDLYAAIQKKFRIGSEVMYVGKLLQYACNNYPDAVALIGNEKQVTYKELFFRAVAFGKLLLSVGIKPRDRVILCCENSLDFYVAYWAAWQCGAVVVPVNVYLHEKELSYVMQDCQPRFIMVSHALQEPFKKIISEGVVAEVPLVIVIQEQINWDEQPIVSENYDIAELATNEACLLLYTSGTTGVPKGVMLSSKNIMTNAMQAYARFCLCGLREGERIFCVLPLFHVFAQNVCVWVPVMTRSAVIVVQKIDRKLILDGLKKKPTLFIGIPALYGLLCLMKTAPLETIKLFISGADMLPDKIRAGFGMIYGRKIAAGYGLTEASPVIAINYKNEEKKTTVAGDVLVGIECLVKDDQGNLIDNGTVGTLWVKGDNVMLGYYNTPEQTAKVLKDGWLNTGDLAMISPDGTLSINGREKDVIIHKGFNIYPAEIENILMSHSGVFKAAVIGINEELSGQVPVAFLAVKNKTQQLECELRELCASNLAFYKIPRKFICLDDLPMNAAGKIDKKRLHA